MRSNRWIGMAALTASLTGCQCFSLTERYQDHIDHIADRSPHLDHWYSAGWDISRIGQPDWYECAWNRHWVSPEHVRGLRPLPGYVHNPIPTPSDLSGRSPIEPLQVEPVPAADPTAPDRSIDQLQPIRDPSQLDEGSLRPPLPPRIPTPPVPDIPAVP